MTDAAEMPVETVLREGLAQGDAVLGTIGPILGHLLANRDHTLFSDEVVARVRGMAMHVARQILRAEAAAGEGVDAAPVPEDRVNGLALALVDDAPFLAHCHALAMEWLLARRLEDSSAIDPVLSPLLQALIASEDEATGSAAMATLAAQARFVQHQPRMELPLGELPADLFHTALTIWRAQAGDLVEDIADAAEDSLRGAYDEGASRLALIARLVSSMGRGVRAALSVSHAGVAMFLSALADASGQERDLAVVSTNDSQFARLALGLRSAGLKAQEVEEQLLQIHPDVALPESFDSLRTDSAGALLGAAARRSIG